MADDGYRYSAETLTGIVRSLHGAAERLDGAAGAELTAPDAGASSDAVGKALANLLSAAATAANRIGHTADNVHASEGGYADVENSNAGVLRRREQAGLGDPAKNIPLN